MKIRNIMRKPVETISADMSVSVAAQMMKKHRIGALPVVKGGRLVGVVTDRDIALRLVSVGKGPNEATVGEIMTTLLHSCRDDQTVEEAAAVMGDRQVRRLPVLDRDERLVGILSLDDIAEDASEHLAGETLGEIVEKR